MTGDVHERLRAFWDADAATYDRSPGHAVADAAETGAWTRAFARLLPPPPSRILDVGAGTGAMSLLAAELGHMVTALDLSPSMLEGARDKALARGLSVEILVGPAHEPPPGPFDAVIERHLVWTLPDPVATLRAWREVAPRAVLLEGLWGRAGALHGMRRRALDLVRRAYGVPDDHHAEYDTDLRAALPFGRGLTPEALVEAAARAGWRRFRVDRLQEVEAARRGSARWPLGPLEAIPRFALSLER
ncbi:MAG: class I SAM-dependent methyltransferase [Actinomycetota bacterium]